ncbi:MAG: hypothetical protein IKY83_04045 [Proteobacteria bacterium]|nr:hypothetical protein [Pseudomonadota bacterium]
MSICILDTSIFLEILNVPDKATQHQKIVSDLKTKLEQNESFLLPMATIIETGNHIAQNGDGTIRRSIAQKFVEQVKKALEGESPFKVIQFPQREDMALWLEQFPDSAMRGSGLGDLSIVQDWEKMCRKNPHHHVYIWSLDNHLSSYCK